MTEDLEYVKQHLETGHITPRFFNEADEALYNILEEMVTEVYDHNDVLLGFVTDQFGWTLDNANKIAQYVYGSNLETAIRENT